MKFNKDPSVKKLLTSFLKYLNDSNIKYCIERNYENYPEIVTGDVDILVESKNISRCTEAFIKLAKKNNWVLYQKNISKFNSYTSFVKKRFLGRFVFTLEIFSNASWKGFNFLSGKKILNNRKKIKFFYKPNPAHEAIITFMHHLFYSNKIPQKYKKRISKLIKIDKKELLKTINEIFYRKYAKLFYNNLINCNWKFFQGKNILKFKIQFIFKKLFSKPISSILKILRGIYFKSFLPEGILIYVSGKNTIIKRNILTQLMNTNYKWHICIPPKKTIINGNSNYKKKAFETIKSGGFCLINIDNKSSIIEKNLGNLPNYKIDILKNKLSLFTSTKIANIVIKNDLEKISNLIWYLILKDRSQEIKND